MPRQICLDRYSPPKFGSFCHEPVYFGINESHPRIIFDSLFVVRQMLISVRFASRTPKKKCWKLITASNFPVIHAVQSGNWQLVQFRYFSICRQWQVLLLFIFSCPRSRDLVVRAASCLASGPGFDLCSLPMEGNSLITCRFRRVLSDRNKTKLSCVTWSISGLN